MKTALCIGIGLTSVMLLCAGCQTAPPQAAPATVVQGPPGPQGPQGQTGDTGQTGNQGYTGDTGRPGDKGYTGDTGQKGDTGDRGKPGPCPDGQHHVTDVASGRVTCEQG